jgi:S-adenosylmethionine:tRNA ribosyltransferase-isomerase
MKAASTAHRSLENTRLLVFPARDQIAHSTVGQLEAYLQAGDVLVVNRSATLPGSFRGHVIGSQAPLEIRLAAFQGPDPAHLHHWRAVAFGSGDWRQPTETRGPAPHIQAGDRLWLGDSLQAEVQGVTHERLLEIVFESPDLLPSLYRYGRPIQYAYHQAPLAVCDQQTLFAGPPISAEPPSAGFPFTWGLIERLRQKGVQIAPLLHSAGLSSTGDATLDQHLPLPEWYEIPADTITHIQTAKQQGRRIVALGTTVLRALESAQQAGGLKAGRGMATLKVVPGYRFQVVNALITGMHEPESSHMRILDALCPMSLIKNGYQEAENQGYRGHEYGDLSLLSCGDT